MKHKIYALAAIAAVAVPAWAEDVYSSNIVGYQKITLAAGYNMVAVQFSEIGGGAQDLSSYFQMDDSYAGYDDDYKFFTTLRVWDGNGYDTYGWAGTSGTDIDNDASLDNTWTDMGAEAVTGEFLASGNGVWIKAEKAGTVLVKGEVPTNIVVQLNAGYNIVANPFPVDVSISNFGILDASYAGYDDDYKFYSTMRVWDGNGYDTYGWAGTSGTDIDNDSSLDNTWTDMGAEAVSGTIPAGTAVWIKAEKAGTITFSVP